jgi:hypothetical protein
LSRALALRRQAALTGHPWGERKARLFDDRSLQIALTRLQQGLV